MDYQLDQILSPVGLVQCESPMSLNSHLLAHKPRQVSTCPTQAWLQQGQIAPRKSHSESDNQIFDQTINAPSLQKTWEIQLSMKRKRKMIHNPMVTLFTPPEFLLCTANTQGEGERVLQESIKIKDCYCLNCSMCMQKKDNAVVQESGWNIAFLFKRVWVPNLRSTTYQMTLSQLLLSVSVSSSVR